jgi:hypothetical protein
MDAEEALARREAWQERHQARMRRRQAWTFLTLGLLWLVLAGLQWLDDDGDAVMRWLWTVLGAGQLLVGLAALRATRRPPPN